MNISPEEGWSSPPTRFRRVLLPEPEGPHDAYELAFPDDQGDVAERLYLLFALAVGLACILQFDH